MERLLSCYYQKVLVNTHKSSDIRFQKAIKEIAETVRINRRDKINQKAGFGSHKNSLAKNKHKKSSRIRRAAVKKAFENNTKESDFGLHDEKPVIPTFEEFLEFALTDLSGKVFRYRIPSNNVRPLIMSASLIFLQKIIKYL